MDTAPYIQYDTRPEDKAHLTCSSPFAREQTDLSSSPPSAMMFIKLREIRDTLRDSMAYAELHREQLGELELRAVKALYPDDDSDRTAHDYGRRFFGGRDLADRQIVELIRLLGPTKDMMTDEAAVAMTTAFECFRRHEDKMLRSMRACIQFTTHAWFLDPRDETRIESYCIGTICSRWWGHPSWTYFMKNIVGKIDKTRPKFERAGPEKRAAMLNDPRSVVRRKAERYVIVAKYKERYEKPPISDCVVM